MEQKDVFYACTIPFLIFFLAFAFIIFPNVDMLHPHLFVDQIASRLPEGFGAPLAIVRNWSFAVFYVMAEMWGSVVASLLFWSFANEVTTVEEAKKYCECQMKAICRFGVDGSSQGLQSSCLQVHVVISYLTFSFL
jgi:AAA family ATP:ADP antiporter